MKSERVEGDDHARNHPRSKTRVTLLLSMTRPITSDPTYSRKFPLVYERFFVLNRYLTVQFKHVLGRYGLRIDFRRV